MRLTEITAMIVLLFAHGSSGPAAATEDPGRWFTPEHATAQLMILGTFHFKDAGLDSYKPEVDVDILSDQRQAELEELLSRLARFRPTKILVEMKRERQPVLDERYSAYLTGSFELSSNEIYQVAFRLAKRLELERLHAVDVFGRAYQNLPDRQEYAREHGQEALLDNPWDERYTELYRYGDHLKAKQTLIEHLLLLNSPEQLRRSHGHYVLRGLALGTGDDYPAADHLTGWWYSRNLRIYANVLRVMEPGDRLLLLIGAGHVPILRHAAEASPEIHVVDPAEYLE